MGLGYKRDLDPCQVLEVASVIATIINLKSKLAVLADRNGDGTRQAHGIKEYSETYEHGRLRLSGKGERHKNKTSIIRKYVAFRHQELEWCSNQISLCQVLRCKQHQQVRR